MVDTPRFSGITEIPKSAREKHMEYFLASRVSGFPLLKVGCDKDHVKSCRITRSCWVNGIQNFSGEKVTGVAVSTKRNLVIMGDASKKALHIFKGLNCINIKYSHTIKLPSEIKQFSNVFVDADDFLWITSAEPDIKRDASLYLFHEW